MKYSFKFIIYSHFTNKENKAPEKVINFHRVTKTVSDWEECPLTTINYVRLKDIFIGKNMIGHGLIYYLLNSQYVSTEERDM